LGFLFGQNLVYKECLSKGSKEASSPQSPFVESKISQPSKKIPKA
jgi:hypothetical protein